MGDFEEAERLRSDIAMVLKEIDAGGAIFRAVIEAGDQDAGRDAIAAVEGVEIGAPMTAGSQPLYAVAFSHDGTMLATAGGDGTARRWDVSFPSGLLAAAGGIAEQSLTREQWADYAGTQPFQQVCPAN